MKYKLTRDQKYHLLIAVKCGEIDTDIFATSEPNNVSFSNVCAAIAEGWIENHPDETLKLLYK